MKKLRNFTLHPQTAREQSLAAESGYDLQAMPEGITVQIGRAGLETAALNQADRLTEAALEGSTVLIGGHTGLWVRTLELLRERGAVRPILAYFDTQRLHDDDGHFIFEPQGLVIIANGAEQP